MITRGPNLYLQITITGGTCNSVLREEGGDKKLLLWPGDLVFSIQEVMSFWMDYEKSIKSDDIHDFKNRKEILRKARFDGEHSADPEEFAEVPIGDSMIDFRGNSICIYLYPETFIDQVLFRIGQDPVLPTLSHWHASYREAFMKRWQELLEI